jgi:hypothetical protein
MAATKIPPMKAPVHTLPRGGTRFHRDQRVSRLIQARRRLSSPRGGGRAWINGREVGGPDSRYAHLSSVYD